MNYDEYGPFQTSGYLQKEKVDSQDDLGEIDQENSNHLIGK
jgi:hypothetical protein